MTLPNQIRPPRFYDGFLGIFFRLAASGLLPARWFRGRIPPEHLRKAGPEFPTVEIVSHCWRYSSLLAYQLSSFINYPPSKLKVVVTVFYSGEDSETSRLLAFIEQHQIPNVEWNWQALPTKQLFRRGIGRNLAARRSKADWVWMTDCDIIFHAGCWDSLATALRGRKQILLFPREERTTPMLTNADPLLNSSSLENGGLQGDGLRKSGLNHGTQPQLLDIDTQRFQTQTRELAKGAFQIIHGDVARAIGYCEGIPIYQTPAEHWCKCYEDRAFRWLVGTQGEPVEVQGVYQIRHVEKGRYRKDSAWSTLRSWIRRVQE